MPVEIMGKIPCYFEVTRYDNKKRLAELPVGLEVDDSAVDLIVQSGFDVTFGARPMKRAVQRMINSV